MLIKTIRDKIIQDTLFLDIEAIKDIQPPKIKEIGLLYDYNTLKTSSLKNAKSFIKIHNPKYIAGHNFINFDMEILKNTSIFMDIKDRVIIDTLPISLLLFNEKTFHELPKKYKDDDNFLNDPIEDSKLSRRLYLKSVKRFFELNPQIQLIFFSLLHEEFLFKGFFKQISQIKEFKSLDSEALFESIKKFFSKTIFNTSKIKDAIQNHPVELSYILALLTPEIEIKAHPPKILYDYPHIINLQKELCFELPNSIDGVKDFAKEIFGFNYFKEFPRLNATLEDKATLSQRDIVEAALKDESFLAVLPTGGGKTLTFWLPALMKAKYYKSLTVVISPLQALMSNHIESFNSQVANFTAVALSGYLSPLERIDAIEKVINGTADILYIAPESLRSQTIFSILKNRLIERFVIDEAHCFSTWGHDFRHDYFYIGDFIKELLDNKPFQKMIPVSCFTATAKPNVIEDIRNYFYNSLGIELKQYIAKPERKNLDYEVFNIKKSSDKYLRLLEILNQRDGAALIYIPSSTSSCDEVAEKLSKDIAPRRVSSFHSKLSPEQKKEILEQFINNEIEVVVATTAFGMGVDKPDIKTVIHYEISDSLENYSQEAGRGARDNRLRALCPILFNENDLDKHFAALNRNKISVNEINAVFRVLKKQKTKKVIMTTLEIAKASNWDVEDDSKEYDVKVKTALLELEREGYLKRSRNKVRYFADAVAKDSFKKLHEKFKEKNTPKKEQEKLTLILNTIVGKGKPKAVQIDEISYVLGYKREEVAVAILKLKEWQIISDSKDLSLFIRKNALKYYADIKKIEFFLLNFFKEMQSETVSMRDLNEALIQNNIIKSNDNKIELTKDILRLWRQAKNGFHCRRVDRQHDGWKIVVESYEKLKKSLEEKHKIAKKVIEYFLSKIDNEKKNKKVYIEFSLLEVQKNINPSIPIKWFDKVLLYLHRIKIIELLDGRFIYYAPMTIYKTDKFDKKLKYTKAEYAVRMKPYYESKIEAIHIIGRYAELLQKNYHQALLFLKDYFTVPYNSFKRKYKLLKEEILRPMTRKRYEKIFNGLSEEQKRVIEDKDSKTVMILAGPGSGKTKVLVHKIASLILKEDVKPNQFLMLTYSRSAVTEFKARLFNLIGPLAYEVDIYTFHSYALQLVGRKIQDSNDLLLRKIIEVAAEKLHNKEINMPFKSVLMLDEFQDINLASFKLIKAIYDNFEGDMRVIAVGDDDQCILESVNGANVSFFNKFKEQFTNDEDDYREHALTKNFRSDKNIVNFANSIVQKLNNRIKTNLLVPNSKEEGIVRFYLYKSSNLEHSVVNEVKNSNKYSSIAILAYTNEEVSTIYSALYEKNIEAKYLIDRYGFKLKNLEEIVYFNDQLKQFCNEDVYIKEEHFYKTLNKTFEYFKGSSHLNLLKLIVENFIKEYDIYYLSLWDTYLSEIKFEDFIKNSNVIVSTMHKAKGKEFEKVIVVLRRSQIDDEMIRLFYVAVTRAKKELIIMTDKKQFVSLLPKETAIIKDNTLYNPIKTKTFIMTLKDVVLSFSGWQNRISKPLISGIKVQIKQINGKYYIYCKNNPIECLSKDFSEKIKNYIQRGYKIDNAEIESMVLWKDKKTNEDIKHALCKIVLKNE